MGQSVILGIALVIVLTKELQSGTECGKNICCKVNRLKYSVWNQRERQKVRVQARGHVYVFGGKC